MLTPTPILFPCRKQKYFILTRYSNLVKLSCCLVRSRPYPTSANDACWQGMLAMCAQDTNIRQEVLPPLHAWFEASRLIEGLTAHAE